MDELKIKELLLELDAIARDYDHYEFGLPMHNDDVIKLMTIAVRRAINPDNVPSTVIDICPSRDDAQKHVYENGICVFCSTKKI